MTDDYAALRARLLFMADVGDMGRGPDPGCTLRAAEKAIGELLADRERMDRAYKIAHNQALTNGGAAQRAESKLRKIAKLVVGD